MLLWNLLFIEKSERQEGNRLQKASAATLSALEEEEENRGVNWFNVQRII